MRCIFCGNAVFFHKEIANIRRRMSLTRTGVANFFSRLGFNTENFAVLCTDLWVGICTTEYFKPDMNRTLLT